MIESGAPFRSPDPSLEGKTPFEDENEVKTYRNITSGKFETPPSVPKNAQKIISDFLVKKLDDRLGYGAGGMDKIKSHPFFKGIDWEKLASPMTDAHPIPAEVTQRIKSTEPVSVEELQNVQEYEGSNTWFKDF